MASICVSSYSIAIENVRIVVYLSNEKSPLSRRHLGMPFFPIQGGVAAAKASCEFCLVTFSLKPNYEPLNENMRWGKTLSIVQKTMEKKREKRYFQEIQQPTT